MKSLVVKGKNCNTVAFRVDINAKKTFEEFFEHEKHWGFQKEAMKEFHDLIRKAAGIVETKIVPVQSQKVKEDVTKFREAVKGAEKSGDEKKSS